MSMNKVDKHALARRFIELGAPEQEKFLSLLQAKGFSFERLPIVPAKECELSPLAPAQLRLWHIYQIDPDNSAYHMVGDFEINGALDHGLFESALQQVLAQHQILRSYFVSKDDVTWLKLDPAPIVPLAVQDWRFKSESELYSFCGKHAQKRFNLSYELPLRVALIQVEQQKWHLQLVMHHIVSDGWSIDIFVRDLVQAYRGVPLTALNIQYTDFSVWQTAMLRAGKAQQQLHYWQEKLGSRQPELLIAHDTSAAIHQLRLAGHCQYSLSTQRTAKVSALALKQGITPSSLLLAVWQLTLAAYSGRNDISVGIPMANRDRSEVAEVIGFFVNTMVIRNQISPSNQAIDCLKLTHESVLEAQENQLLPFDQLVDGLGVSRNAGETPLFQVLFNHQQTSDSSIELVSGVNIKSCDQQGCHALFDLALDIKESIQVPWELILTYAKDRFKLSTAEQLLSGFIKFLDEIVEQPRILVGQLNLVNQQAIEQLNVFSTQAHTWEYQPLPLLIQQQAELRPDAIALVHGNERLSYQALNEQANQLSHYLIEQGVGTDIPVGVAFERGNTMLIAMLAVLKAGGAFLPLDPAYPNERLRYMLADSGVDLLLTDSTLIAQVPCPDGIKSVYLDQQMMDSYSINTPDVELHQQQLAYLIYTSGSTGKPKGVALTHAGLSMHVQTIGERYGMTPDDVELHFASISFDGAVERWAVPLAFGSRLVIRDQALWSAEKTCDVLEQEGVTIACFPPSYVGTLLDWISYSKPNLTVRSWTLGGEAFTRETYDRLQGVLKPQRIINGYGPTETVVTPMIWEAYAETELSSAYAPIGTAVGERRLYILDPQLNRVPLGMSGELYIGAEVGLARGYHARADLTAERFLPDPYGVAGERMYRTGDLVRWRDDGVMEYLGRIDQQIKIRGFRVELGEIESKLQLLSGAEHCAVVAHEAPGGKRLVGYLQQAAEFDERELLQRLAVELPDYMVPATLVVLAKLPLTPAGKIDRQNLLAPNWHALDDTSYIAPKGETEALLSQLWKTLLGVELVGRESNFFALGGDSILALQLVSQVRQAGLLLTPKDIFEQPVLKQLAALLQKVTEQKVQVLPTSEFPLMPIQQHFFSQQPAEPSHWNQHVCVELKQDMNVDVLAKSLHSIVTHHPALRLKFSHGNKGWVQQYTDVISSDLLWNCKIEDDAEFSALALELQQSLNIYRGDLLRAALIKQPQKADRLLLVIHHLAIDGFSWRILFDDLWLAYQQLSTEQEIQLPAVSENYNQVIEQLNIWTRTLDMQQQREYWFAQGSSSPSSLPLPIYKNRRTVSVKLGIEDTQILLRKTVGQLNVPTPNLLITSLVQTLASVDKPDLHLYLEGHGREESVFGALDLSRTMGWMTSLYPIKLSWSAYAEICLESVAQCLNEAQQHGGIGYGAMMSYESSKSSVNVDITFNYLGQYVDNGFSHWCKPIVAGGPAQSDLNPMLTPLVINAQITEGQLSLDWEYAHTHHTENEVTQWANDLVVNLQKWLGRIGKNTEVKADLRLLEPLNQACGTEPAIFCIHPVTGRTTGYQLLAERLAGKRHLIGIQSRSFIDDGWFDASLSAMAESYYQTIKSVQNEGPYYLLGWSLGGALCLEVAAKLEANKQEVAFIGLLDCYVPGFEVADDQWHSPKAQQKLMEHLSLLLSPLSQYQSQQCLKLLNESSPEHWPSQFDMWLSKMPVSRHMAENARQVLFSWAIEQHMRAICADYQLARVDSNVESWWAANPEGRAQQLSAGLENINSLTSKKIVNSDHLGIVRDEDVISDLIARLLNK